MSRKNADIDIMKSKIVKKIIITLVFLVLAIFLIFIYIGKNNKAKEMFYENGETSYNVSLTKNDFYDENILPENNQYIAALIDKINVNFKYNCKLEEKLSNYKYKYKVETRTKVIEKNTKNNIYDFKEELKSEETKNIEDNNFTINNEISIDYIKYDDIIRKLVSTYDLNNIESKLDVVFYVDLLDENGIVKNTSTMIVHIPLNSNTINIEVENNINNSEPKLLSEKQDNMTNTILILIFITLLILGIVNIVSIVKLVKADLSNESIDDIHLKKILKEYGPYIQRVDTGFDMSKYILMKMKKFEDLLRIREVTQQPILMFENETNTKAYFIIMTATDILYVYELNHGNVKEIEG